MKYLLENRFAPTTFSWGFIEAPFARVVSTYMSWSDSIFAKFGLQSEVLKLNNDLPNLLDHLFPVAAPATRDMLTETDSSWTAYFDNNWVGADAISRVSHMCELLRCRGIAVECRPHRHPEEQTGVYGGVHFQLFAPQETEFLNYLRGVSVGHDGERWVFHATGPIQPFEETLEYGAHRVRDRFTPLMLERYCAALGIDLFAPDFYGPNAVLLINKGPFASEPKCFSRQEALEKLGLP